VRQGRSRKRFKAGYINCLGDVVIAANFQQAYPFRNGLASVQKEGRWGAINAGGELVIPAAYGSPLVFTEGLAEFSFDNHTAGNRRGVISLSGEIIVRPRYQSISHFSGGLACVSTDDLYGYIDSHGNQGNRKGSPLRGPKGQPCVEGRLGRVWQLRPTPSASFAGMTRWLGKGDRRKVPTGSACLVTVTILLGSLPSLPDGSAALSLSRLAALGNWDSNSHSFCITHG
jgi:hypothetical protein